jgi:hypothetical protein
MDADHPHACTGIRRRGVTERHDDVIRALADFAKQYGISTSIEPKPYEGSSESPDLLLRFPDRERSLTVDVTIVHPLCESNTRTSDILRARANAKNVKYAAKEREHGRDFFPFVLTSFGALHLDAIDRGLRPIAQRASVRSRMIDPNFFLQKLIRMLTLCIYKGAAECFQQSLRVCV